MIDICFIKFISSPNNSMRGAIYTWDRLHPVFVFKTSFVFSVIYVNYHVIITLGYTARQFFTANIIKSAAKSLTCYRVGSMVAVV